MAEWVRASTRDRTFDGSSPTSVKTVLFRTLAIPFTPLARLDSKSRWSLLSGDYSRGSKISHQSALECVGPNFRGLHLPL